MNNFGETTRVITRSGSGEAEYRVARKTDEDGRIYEELQKNRFIYTIGRAAVKCAGDCDTCELSFFERDQLSRYSEMSQLVNENNEVEPGKFEVKTLDACDKLNEGGILDCRDLNKAIIQPKKEYAKQKEGELYVRAVVLDSPLPA